MTIDSAKVYIFPVGGDPSATPLASQNIGAASMIGSSTFVTFSAPALNPSAVYWTDPNNAARQVHAALIPLGAGGMNLADGTYDLRLSFTSSGVEGPKSAPFQVQTEPPPPPAPTGVGAA